MSDEQRQWLASEEKLLNGTQAWENWAFSTSTNSSGTGGRSTMATIQHGTMHTKEGAVSSRDGQRLECESSRSNNNICTNASSSKYSSTNNEARQPKVYNDAKLSLTKPWRSRYPTPHSLKEQLASRFMSDDGV